MQFDIGRFRDLIFVPCDQDVVFGRDQVWLYEVRPEFNGKLVGGEGVLGSIPACAAMSYDDRFFPIAAGRAASISRVPQIDCENRKQHTQGYQP